jgi:hypothetical protein
LKAAPPEGLDERFASAHGCQQRCAAPSTIAQRAAQRNGKAAMRTPVLADGPAGAAYRARLRAADVRLSSFFGAPKQGQVKGS